MSKFAQKSTVLALVAANATYVARTGSAAKVNASGVQPDIAHAIKTVEAFTAPQWDALNALGVSDAVNKGIKGASNVKVCKRIAQVLGFIATGDARYIKGSARTFLIDVAALHLAGAKSRDAMRYASTGKGNESTSDEINVSVARGLHRLGCTAPASEATQYSVSFAANGMGAILGVATKTGRGALPVVNVESPFFAPIIARVGALTSLDAQIIAGDKGEA